ncbi:MAG: carbonic anhydrase [Candidatus Lokiarchaeota archaeon]|nr:carbonic anhydrase [Candidatus Lokiarchaeota archaeon]
MNELERLKDGNLRFIKNQPIKKDFIERRAELLEGQTPFATIITCSDSRVIPEYIFDTNLGELFIIRVAGNITDKSVLGSIEYGIIHCHTPLLVILGHSKCGAVTAACQRKSEEGNSIDYIVDKIKPALKKIPNKDIEETIEENVKCVIEDILENSPAIKELKEKGQLKIIGMKYILETGEIKIL